MRVAIVGCGQLARMLALSGIPLGIKFSFIADQGPEMNIDCVAGLGLTVPWQAGDCVSELYQRLGQPDVVTVEKEQLDINLLKALSEYCEICPGVEAVEKTQNRLYERQLLDGLSIPVAEYCYGASVEKAARQLAYPFVLKSLDNGYDGKNQWLIKASEDLAAFNSIQQKPEVLAEKWLQFERELSLIAGRNKEGAMVFYPLAENLHCDGILHSTIAPAPDISDPLLAQAQGYLTTIMNALDYVGVMAMECFVTSNGLIVNELAPRVHNSGHWTQAGSFTCQFENHLRAITGMELGSTQTYGAAGMVNLLGTSEPPIKAIGHCASLHWYNKEPRPGRKLGHVNFVEGSLDKVITHMTAFEQCQKTA